MLEFIDKFANKHPKTSNAMHVLMGLSAKSNPAITYAFFAYQFKDYLKDRNVKSLIGDIGEFILGYGMADRK
tara:strand:+ start:474 stop:689 length:216 start_codon:yes stop_codon:yes gene_type:complete